MRWPSATLAASFLAVAVLPWATSCAGRSALLEVSGSVMYEKPTIARVTHALDDRRGDGGPARVTVTLVGDPGLSASFDITPGVVDRKAMAEVEAGRYVGEYAFPADSVGGPYSIIGRLRHAQAGEVVQRDSEPIIFSMPDRAGE